MSSPTLERARPSRRALASGRFVREWARVPQALVQDSQASRRAGIRLGDLAILSRHAVARDERIGGGPVRHTRHTELERLAGPSAPRHGHATSHARAHSAHLTACRAAQAYAPISTHFVRPHLWLRRVARNWLWISAWSHKLLDLDGEHFCRVHLAVEELDDPPQLSWNLVGYEKQSDPPSLEVRFH